MKQKWSSSRSWSFTGGVPLGGSTNKFLQGQLVRHWKTTCAEIKNAQMLLKRFITPPVYSIRGTATHMYIYIYFSISMSDTVDFIHQNRPISLFESQSEDYRFWQDCEL